MITATRAVRLDFSVWAADQLTLDVLLRELNAYVDRLYRVIEPPRAEGGAVTLLSVRRVPR